jgi:tetratricopeptide (TPR) repeat protein
MGEKVDPNQFLHEIQYYRSNEPNEAMALQAEGNFERAKGNYKKAIKKFSQSHSIYSSPHTLCYRAICYSSLGDYKRAIKDYEEIFSRWNWDAHQDGDHLIKLWKQNLEDCRKKLSESPKRSESLFERCKKLFF